MRGIKLSFDLVTKSLRLAVYHFLNLVICRAIDRLLHALLRGPLKIETLPLLVPKRSIPTVKPTVHCTLCTKSCVMGLLATYLFVYLLYNICKPSFREKYIYLQIDFFYK